MILIKRQFRDKLRSESVMIGVRLYFGRQTHPIICIVLINLLVLWNLNLKVLHADLFIRIYKITSFNYG